MTIFRNLLPPAREPSLLLTFAVLCFNSGDNASDCADKIHAHIAFDETCPIALAATPELYAVSNVSLAESKRRRSGKHVLENPNLSGTFGAGLCGKVCGKFRCSVVTARAAASADVRSGFGDCSISRPTPTGADVKRAATFLRFAPWFSCA
ncbi:hypothetical protein PQR16_35415 [Caballeronia glebae]